MNKVSVSTRDIPQGVFFGIIIAMLALVGWIMFRATELPGAKNPPGTPGNADPFLSSSGSAAQGNSGFRGPGRGAGQPQGGGR